MMISSDSVENLIKSSINYEIHKAHVLVTFPVKKSIKVIFHHCSSQTNELKWIIQTPISDDLSEWKREQQMVHGNDDTLFCERHSIMTENCLKVKPAPTKSNSSLSSGF